MGWFFFKKKDDKEVHKKIEKLHDSLHTSFKNIKEDMDHFSKWNNNFKERHNQHDLAIDNINRRLDLIESLLKNKPLEEKELIELEEMEQEPSFIKEAISDELTDIQKSICFTLAALQKENPERWISLKEFAQERYPKKSYNAVRSTLSEYTSNLEELGYIQKRKKGKQVYIISTDKNPYLKQKILKKIKVKTK